jgi:hypothetical protein
MMRTPAPIEASTVSKGSASAASKAAFVQALAGNRSVKGERELSGASLAAGRELSTVSMAAVSPVRLTNRDVNGAAFI